MQVATVAAWDTEGAPAEAAGCAAAAQQILIEVLTDSSHGIAPPVEAGQGESSHDNHPSESPSPSCSNHAWSGGWCQAVKAVLQ